MYSSVSTAQFYHFRSVPDLIFTRSATTSGGGAMYTSDKSDNLLEIKHGGRLEYAKLSNIPNVYAQITGGLHFLTVARLM